jgi:hypothetical protein
MGNSNSNKIFDHQDFDDSTDLDSTNDINTIIDLDISDNDNNDVDIDKYKKIKTNLDNKSFLDGKFFLDIKSNLQNIVESNEDNEKIYKLTVEEKINNSSEYEIKKGIYLEVLGGHGHTKIYKNMFKKLDSYKLIMELYEGCMQGLQLKPIEYCFLTWFYKLTVSQTMQFNDKSMLEINDSDYNFGHGCSTIMLEINNKNKESFFHMLNWIKKSLEELYPELREGFVYVMCGYIEDKKKPLEMNKSFRKIFKKVYGEKYIQDEHLGIKSKCRQDERVFNLIKELKLEEPKIIIYKIPKFMLSYCEIDFNYNNNYGEQIKIKWELLFYEKFYKLNEEINKQYFYSDESMCKYKSEQFEILQNFNKLIKGLDWGFDSNSFIKLN